MRERNEQRMLRYGDVHQSGSSPCNLFNGIYRCAVAQARRAVQDAADEDYCQMFQVYASYDFPRPAVHSTEYLYCSQDTSG